MTGTNHYRHTRVEESRVGRLTRRRDPKGSLIRKPFLTFSRELQAMLLFVLLFAASGGVYLFLNRSAAVDSTSNLYLIAAFTLGFVIACAVASSLAVLTLLGHRLLLLAFISGAVAIAAIVFGVGPLETAAKLVFAACAGLWLGLMLSSISQVLLISGLIIVVDFYSVFLGPTKKLVESGSHWLDYLTISLPTFGVPAISRIGISDLVFFSLFTACTLTYRLRRITTAMAMTASFVGTMVVGVTLDRGVPALPLLSISFVLANADLLYRRFLEEPDELRKRGRS
ncbi:MAG: hypothetical protein ACYCXU_03755 [Thermoleophilia bacterium]